jgi:transcriptional regulator with XRE-family HTH domain
MTFSKQHVVHYFRLPDSEMIEEHLRLYSDSPAGLGHVTPEPRHDQAAAGGELVVSVIEPDPEEERDAAEQLSGPTLETWHRSAPRRALSAALRGMRQDSGLSQTELAALIGVTQSDVARMESATGPWPNQAKLAAYAAACGRIAVTGFLRAGDAEEPSSMTLVKLGWTSGERPGETADADTTRATVDPQQYLSK